MERIKKEMERNVRMHITDFSFYLKLDFDVCVFGMQVQYMLEQLYVLTTLMWKMHYIL